MFDIETYQDEFVIKVAQNVDVAVLEKQMQAYASAMTSSTGVTSTMLHPDIAELEKRIRDSTRRAAPKIEPYGWVIEELLVEEQDWARAFRDVLVAGINFYINAPASRKRQLEREYQALAQHNSKKGRAAAKVVAARVKYFIERSNAPVMMRGSPTGRMQHPQAQQISKIRGAQYHTLIMDDAINGKDEP